MGKKDHLEEFLNLAKTIFIKTREFYDKQYPGTPDTVKIIPITLFATKVWENYWGAKFHAKRDMVNMQTQQAGAVDTAKKILKDMGVGK